MFKSCLVYERDFTISGDVGKAANGQLITQNKELGVVKRKKKKKREKTKVRQKDSERKKK